MQKKINSSIILGTIMTCIFTALSLWELLCIAPVTEKYPELVIMLSSIYGAFIIMLVQILFLIRKQNINNVVIVVAFDSSKLALINSVPAASGINMCRKMDEMEYKTASWPTYRCCLLAKRDEAHNNLVAAGDKLFSEDEPYYKKYVASLKYKEYGGKESHIIHRLSDMPDEIEAAILLISSYSSDGQIFYSAKELAEWYRSLPVHKQNEWAKPVHRFLKDGTPYYS